MFNATNQEFLVCGIINLYFIPNYIPNLVLYFGWDLIYKLYKQNAQKLSNKNAQFIGNRIIQVLHSGGGTCVNKYQEQEKEKQKKQNKSR